MQIYIHIGFGKTGTSSIQKMMLENRDYFLAHGVYYPEIGIYDCAHHHLADFSKHEMPTGVKEQFEKILSTAKEQEAKSIVISSEQFCFCKPTYIQQISDIFKDYIVSILFYYREQISLIKSSYLQKVKEGKQYYGTIKDYFDHDKIAFNYMERISPWISAFGLEHITSVLYSKEINVCDNFLTHIHLLKNHTIQYQIYSNPSLLPETVDIIRYLDSLNLSENRHVFIDHLLDISNQFKKCSSNNLIDEKLQKEICTYYASSNQKFYELFPNAGN